MVRETGPTRGPPPMGPPGDDRPPFDMGPPGWGPPPGWPPLDEWGPPPPEGWGPLPPHGWGPPPPDGWGPRGPPPPDWDPRRPPPPGWPHPDDWLPPPDWRRLHPDDWRRLHPDDWRRLHPDDWRRLHPDDWRSLTEEWRHIRDVDWRTPRDGWRLPPEGWGPPHCWGPDGPPPPETWGPDCPPPPIPPIPPPDPAAFATMPVPPIAPPIAPPECVPPVPPPLPPFGFPTYPPPGWTEPPPVEEAMPNPPPDQPEWIKALISAPTSEATGADPKAKTSSEDHLAIKPPEAPSAPSALVLPKPKKPKAVKLAKTLALLGKRTFEKPPPGRSTGIISFIGPTFGHVEREDLEKFTFSFDAFFGNPKAMTPGVRVHFTACKEKKNQIATDVKVAPGGTENVDPDIYEAVVSQPIIEPQPGERHYPGQVYVTIGPLRTNLSFERRDSTVTLLKEDQVLINLLSDLVTEKRRATNIRPKIPATFSYTKETRETGVIISLEDGVGVIKSDEHGEIPFEIRENFSDVEFTAEDINEEVEFTIVMLRNGKRAIRIRRVKEPLLLTLCSAATDTSKVDDEDDEDEEDSEDEANMPLFLKPKSRPEQGPNMKLDMELYEGIVSQPIIEPTINMPGYPGQIHANIGPLKTNVTFDHRDCGVTLLKNDHVLINLLIDMTNKKRRAANIKPKIPFTFSYTKEKRELGVITFLGAEEGIVNSDEHGELPFDICENFSDTEFNSQDIHKEVEFTMAQVQLKKRAIRLMRTRKINDKILEEQKKRCEEEKKKKGNEGEDQRRQDEEERRKKEEEEERCKEAERKKKEEVAAALAAAQHKWTPFGFKMRDPDSQDEISKDRFEGTVLKAIGKHPQNEMKKEPHNKTEESGGGALNGQTNLQQVKIKEEKEDELKPAAGEEQTEMKIKKEEEDEEVMKAEPTSDLGRLVMTIDGQQKQLPFGPGDLLTTATMLDGDKVRFNVATNQDTKVERATYVEILPDSFEESTEQRRHGIVIEFSFDSGLIKCSQNPQLYFHMSEVIERKKLELNEKVEFSVVPHETAEGGNQAIRIKRYTESIFLPTRKLGGVGANKGKMTIKLTKPDVTEKEKPDTDKLKAVVKNLRAQDSRSRREYSATRRRYSSRSRSRSRSRGKTRSSSRSPPRDQFGRVSKRKRSPSIDRDRKGSRFRRSQSREKRSRRTRSRSLSPSRTRSRSRSRERSKEQSGKRRSKSSREREESHRRRKELSPPPSRRPGLMDDELARKKRELEELNEMIAYKKSLVDPRGMDPGQRTCIDYDHGRIAVPLTEYQPVRSILKKRPEGSEYHHRPPQPYDDPYYDRPYQDHRYSDPYAKRYGDPYTSHPYPDRPYSERPFGDRPYESHVYSEVPYTAPSATSNRYTDRYDVYDEPFDDRYSDQVYADRHYTSPYPPSKRSQSPEPCRSSPNSQSTPIPGSSTQNLSTRPSAGPPFRPPSPAESPPRSPSPKRKSTSPPPVEKPPLDRFLDMLNKKKSDTGKVSEPIVHDDLLPHERALQDGRGFSRIVGLTQEQPSTNLPLEMELKPQSPKPSSAERITKELNNAEQPYDKIQSLLRTIGLKLSTGDMSKLSNRTQQPIYSPKSTSAERDIPREEQRTSRTSSVESDRMHSPSPARSSSLEQRHKVVNEYEGFLDQQELEVLQKAQQLQSLTRTMGSTSHSAPAPKHPPGSPPTQYQHLPPSMSWSLDTPPSSQSSSSLTQTPTTVAEPAQKLPRPPPGPPPGPPPRRPSLQTPPGPPPGPPPRRPPGQPPFIPTSSHGFPFIGQSSTAPPTASSISSQPPTTAETASPSTPATSAPSSNEDAAISTTVARCLKVIETVKSLAVQPPTKPVKSVQFSLPSSTPQASTETEGETKSLQKEKTDLFNPRTMEKREHEYQRKKQEKSKDGAEISPGKPIGSEQKNIWICGHSLVYWAESRSRSAEVGVHLDLDPRRMALWWKGVQGMTWPQLLPQLHQLKVTWPNPDILIMHLGGNDLSTDSPTDLLASVRRDLTSMRTIFPRCVLVWSYILPRRVWRHSSDSYEVDLVRTTVNRRIHSIVSELGGASLTHDNIRCGTNTGLYRADGIHLSPKGIDMFNLNLRDFLEKWEAEVNKAE